MPVTTTYPGVYIEELPSSVRTIVAVSTSVTAFVGTATRGPLDTPVTLTSFADFERRFGGLTPGSVLGHAVQQFFLNGGSIAIVVRVAGAGAAQARLSIARGAAGSSLDVLAAEPGTFSDGLRVVVDYATPTPDDTFNLQVTDLTGSVRETHRNLSANRSSARFVENIVNGSSSVLRVTVTGDDAERPDANGTVSNNFPTPLPNLAQTFTVVAEPGGEADVTLYDPATDGSAPTTVAGVAVLLERKLRRALPGSPAFSGARVH